MCKYILREIITNTRLQFGKLARQSPFVAFVAQ